MIWKTIKYIILLGEDKASSKCATKCQAKIVVKPCHYFYFMLKYP